MKTSKHLLTSCLFIGLVTIQGFSQVSKSTDQKDESKTESSKTAGLRKIASGSGLKALDIEIDEEAMENSIEEAIELLEISLAKLEINLEQIEINLGELNIDIDPLMTTIPAFDFNFEPIELNLDDMDVDIDIDEEQFNWDEFNQSFDAEKEKDKMKNKSEKKEKKTKDKSKGLKKIK